jgi:hypothetical protein
MTVRDQEWTVHVPFHIGKEFEDMELLDYLQPKLEWGYSSAYVGS